MELVAVSCYWEDSCKGGSSRKEEDWTNKESESDQRRKEEEEEESIYLRKQTEIHSRGPFGAQVSSCSPQVTSARSPYLMSSIAI